MKPLTTWFSVLASIAILVPSMPPKDICVVHWQSINYHPLARQARLQGDVSLEVSVDPDGKVSDVRVLPSNYLTLPVCSELLWFLGMSLVSTSVLK